MYGKQFSLLKLLTAKQLLLPTSSLLHPSAPKGEGPNFAKIVKKNLSIGLIWTQSDKYPQGYIVPCCCDLSLDAIHADCVASQKLARLTTETLIHELHHKVINPRPKSTPIQSTGRIFSISIEQDLNTAKNTAKKGIKRWYIKKKRKNNFKKDQN